MNHEETAMESSGLATSRNCNGDATFGVAEKALKHLASIDLIELCNEAKVEQCRATRYLRSCGCYVQHVLNSCGHASLCKECSQQCKLCPICRTPVPKNNDKLQLRLYYECIEAGLISKRRDDRFTEGENRDEKVVDDVQRLYSLFDVALENNLVSLICQYVTDVCMDESAVSSDPVIAILLDEVVVKDWCKRTFRLIMSELQGIYNCAVEEMKSRLDLLLNFSIRLHGISNVLEVLESSFRGTLSEQNHDLHHLQESILKTKQHLEIMVWCVRHQFLEHVRSRYINLSSWRFSVRERKSAAIRRSWPDSVNPSAESTRQEGSLFIEDALSNLDIDQAYTQETGELDVASLQKDDGLLVFRSKIEGVAGCYPFENLRAATDVLFLLGSSDLVVAKQAIFIYYLFDRHWTVPSENWRHIMDDFAATFGIGKHSLLESFTFYLMDDHTDEALQEACRILPEISGPSTHPKIAQVLLERQNPDAALMVLRWSGRDGSQFVPLGEAVTSVRVRVECGLVTEAFMYQRTLCIKIKEKKSKHGPSIDASDDLNDEGRTWKDWVETLVTEICCLCIRRNLVDRMIELPWNCDEEIYLHKCLLEYAIEDPSATVGSLLVVFYLQRYRYPEAYQVDRKLQNIERDYISKNSTNEEVLLKMRSASHWRAALVDKSLELLPEVQQVQVRTGKILGSSISRVNESDLPATSDIFKSLEQKSTSLLVPSSADSPLVLGNGLRALSSSKPSVFETPSKLDGSHGPTSVLHERFFTPQTSISKISKFDGIPLSGVRRGAPFSTSPLNLVKRSSLRALQNSHLQDNSQYDKVLPEVEDASDQLQNNSSLYSHRAPNSNLGLNKSSTRESYPNASNKRSTSDGPTRSWNMVTSDDPMDVSWRYEENGSPAEGLNIGGPRWRSDDTSDDETDQSPEKPQFQATPVRRIRKSRFARR